ncbi:MAG: peptidylprolyl isomerase [Clostridia bacterium]|nr:peptidylprolyl isomerase [Clostridia bacterium]
MEKVQIKLKDGRVMNIELYRQYAPISVDNFLSLVDEKFFDGLCFHRVIANFMIQGGGFEWKNTLVHKQAKNTIKGEFMANGVNNTLHHEPGVISMARTAFPNSASSQFFICVEDLPYLDGQYAAFGKTADEESLAVAMEISTVKTGFCDGYGDVPIVPVEIETIVRI